MILNFGGALAQDQHLQGTLGPTMTTVPFYLKVND